MCWYCGSPVAESEPLGRSLRCETCGRDLRSCRNCRFFLLGSRADCAEAKAEMVADKERGNFCDWFALNPAFRNAGKGEKNDASVSKARAAFDDLFS